MNQPLEKYRIFPYVAWALIIGFAIFTLMLARNLSDTANALSARESATKAYLHTLP